jgi:hypothetical protein
MKKDNSICFLINIKLPNHFEIRLLYIVLAHIICYHKRNKKDFEFEIPFGMMEFDEVQEEVVVAKCLGSTLQLTRPCLLWA